MGNFSFCNALIISVKPAAENRSSVQILTEKEGFIYATLYGGTKSKLKSLVSPWNSGILYLSKSNNSQNLKISDFEVKNYHLSFRTDLYKNLASSMALEIVLKTKCGGTYEKAWYLLNGFLSGLDLCQEKSQAELGFLRFLWRYLNLLGVIPELTVCSECASTFLNTDFVYFLHSEQNFVCRKCFSYKAPNEKFYFKIQENTLKYLNNILTLKPSLVRNIPITAENLTEMKQFIFYLVENVCPEKLKTLQMAKGIL